MPNDWVEILSGRRRGAAASAIRGAARAIEPLYAGAMTFRNALFDRSLRRAHALGRPVISVGNLTTGGTGKTPVVRWLAEQLQIANHHTAILMRGYKSAGGKSGDEEQLLRDALGATIPIHADPDRVRGAAAVLQSQPDVDVFILDDGFQHRRAARAFDLVLIDATNPFGFDHILPRGLLREPISGLRRANAILLTRCDLVEDATIERLIKQLADLSPVARIVRTSFRQFFVRENEQVETDFLKDRRVIALSAIGNPQAFEAQLARAGARVIDSVRFADHHAYRAADLDAIQILAREKSAELVVTTEKDWVKLRVLPAANPSVPILRAGVEVEFDDGGEQTILNDIIAAIRMSKTN